MLSTEAGPDERSSDPQPSNPTGPSPLLEQKTARWTKARRTLFQKSSAVATKQVPPGNPSSAAVTDDEHTLGLDTKLPSLHNCTSIPPSPPSPAPTWPPERRRDDGIAPEPAPPCARPFRPRGTVRLSNYCCTD